MDNKKEDNEKEDNEKAVAIHWGLKRLKCKSCFTSVAGAASPQKIGRIS